MKKETEHGSEQKTAEKPRWDNWHVRLPNPKDQQRAIDLFQRSGAKTKSDFVRARILGEHFKVITVEQSVGIYAKVAKCRNEGCDFHVFREICGTLLTEDNIRDLIITGRTPVLNGLTSKAGKKFNARLVLNEEYTTSFVFENKKGKQRGR